MFKRKTTKINDTSEPVAAAPVTENLDRLASIEQAARNDLAGARELRLELLDALTAGQDKTAELAALDGEVAQLEAKLRSFAEARARRDAANTSDARDARFQGQVASCQRAIDEAREVGKQSQELLAILAEVGARLKTIAALRAGIEASIGDAITSTNSHQHTADTQHRRLRNAVNELACPDLVLRSLYEMGLGRVGVALPEGYFSVRRPSPEWGTQPAETVVADAVQQIRAVANGALNALKPQQEAA